MKIKLEKQKGKKSKVVIRIEKTIDDIILGTLPEEDKFMTALIEEVTKRHRVECKSSDRNEAVLTLVNPEDEKKVNEPKEEFIDENLKVIKQETGKITKLYTQDSASGNKQASKGTYLSGGDNLSGDYSSGAISKNPQNMYSKGQAMTLNCNCCGEAVKINPQDLKKAEQSVSLHEIGKTAGAEYMADTGSFSYSGSSEQQPYSQGPSTMPSGAYTGNKENEYI